MIKKIIITVILVFMLSSFYVNAEPYSNYVYDNEGTAQAEPQAYIPDEIITGEDIGIENFDSPKNIYVSNDNLIYIVDTGNNRIIVIDEKYKLKKIIDKFNNNGKIDTFNMPQAVFCTDDLIYIADTGNSRIVITDYDLNVKNIFGKPDSKLITEDFGYEPINIAVDSAGRIFVVSRSVNDGIIELTPNGEFVGFLGAVKSKLSFFETMWKLIATKEQKAKMQLSLPTEYASIDIDKQGFIYGTVSAITDDNFLPEMFISRLNPMGNDILKRQGFFAPMGDVEVSTNSKLEKEYSSLVDIAVRQSGIYSVLDQRKGRIFTYNSTGELMYVFGALGKEKGQFGMPEAVDTINRDTFLVVDSAYNWISVFKPTEYGKIITNAVVSFYNRDYEKADEYWNEALKYTSKSDLAFDGIGRSLAKKGNYSEALKYLKSAKDRKNYSSSYELFRSEVISGHFTLIAVLILITVIAFYLGHLIKKYKRMGRRKSAKNK